MRSAAEVMSKMLIKMQNAHGEQNGTRDKHVQTGLIS